MKRKFDSNALRGFALALVLFFALLLAGCPNQNSGDLSGVVLLPLVKGCAETDKGMAVRSMAEGTEQAPKIEVNGNEVVYSRAISHQCCRKVEITKETGKAAINVYETWSGAGCRCMCFSEIKAKLENVPAGAYTINVYANGTGGDGAPAEQSLIISQKIFVQGNPVADITNATRNSTTNNTNPTQNYTTNNTNDVPKDKATCEAKGGRWGPIGIFPEEVCVLPTSDAGKICSDSKECEGICEASLSKDDYDRLVNYHIPVLTKGACSAQRTSIGCHAIVENGIVYGILCVD